MRRFFVCFLILSGCTAGVPVRNQTGTQALPSQAPVSHSFREMIVYVPQTDDAASAWLKWFVKYPDLRMVIAVSPRFQRISKDPQIKSQIQTLQKEGRLELALQIPNAPILPLLLTNPPYGFSEDVVQLIAQSKAGFFKQWNALPHGLVLPYGATDFKLVSLLEKLGFSYIVGALEAPAVDGPYRSDSLMIWDGAPASPAAALRPLPRGEGRGEATVVRVWDERQTKDRSLDAWVADVKTKSGTFILPEDSGLAPTPLTSQSAFKARTWTDTDWSLWIGSPAKNSAWSALRKTRETLETYKNSGQASVSRLDVAFEQIYGAQNSNYFSSIGNPAISPGLAEEREHEFQATLLAVYRVIGKPPPEDLFSATETGILPAIRNSSTTIKAESFKDGREHVFITETAGDALIPNGPDLKSLEIWAASDTIHWNVSLTTVTPSAIEIYADLNNQPNAGTPSFLSSGFVAGSSDGWEYALSLAGPMATLYRTQGGGTYSLIQTFPVVVEGNSWRVTLPREMMRGSPKRWGYQVVVMSGTSVSDFIDPSEISQKELWQDLSAHKRTDIPFVRMKK